MARKKAPEPDPARLAEVLRIRLDGAQLHDVIDYAAEKAWGLTEAEVRALIRRADDTLVARRETSKKRIRARHVAQREALYARALNGGDVRTALAVLADLAKLQGLTDEARQRRDLLNLARAQDARIAELEADLERARSAVLVLGPAVREVTSGEGQARPQEDAVGPQEAHAH